MLERFAQTAVKRRGREVEVRIELPDAEPAAGIRALLREFAGGALQPGRAVLERLWPRRRAAPGEAVRNLIVVGTDGSEHAVAAVEAAAALAAAWDAKLDVVGVDRFLAPEEPEVTAAVMASAPERARSSRAGSSEASPTWSPSARRATC